MPNHNLALPYPARSLERAFEQRSPPFRMWITRKRRASIPVRTVQPVEPLSKYSKRKEHTCLGTLGTVSALVEAGVKESDSSI